MSNNLRLRFTSFPFLERPITSALLVVFLVLLSVWLWQLAVVKWDMPLYYIIGLLLVVINLAPYFIPTTYLFYEERIEIHYSFIKIQRRYTDFGCYYSDKRGVQLGTFKTPRRLDGFRGQSIRYSKTAQEKEALHALLAEKIGKAY